MKKAVRFTYLIPAAIVAATFFDHGTRAVGLQESFIEIVQYVGFSLEVAIVLVFVVGIIDITVAISILIFHNRFIYWYAALWPVVPAALGYLTSRHDLFYELLHALYPALMVILLIYLRRKFSHGNID